MCVDERQPLCKALKLSELLLQAPGNGFVGQWGSQRVLLIGGEDFNGGESLMEEILGLKLLFFSVV